MKKLIPMTDFVLVQSSETYDKEQFIDRIESYANLLKQPLELWMFFPCDDDGNVLEEPIPFDYTDEEYSIWCKSQSRVLFDELEIDCAKHLIIMGRNVEYLANFNRIKLTPIAIKQIGL